MENAIVLCVDEKSQIPALDRTVPVLPMQPGLIERRSHDYYRYGTSALFAALDIATGQVTAALKQRHRHQEFLAFLKQIERTYRHVLDEDGVPVELHLVMDNYAAHKHKNVREWLEKNPRFKVHFTPTHASWMNLVEVWFGIVERQAIRRGVFKSVKDLLRACGWNLGLQPRVSFTEHPAPAGFRFPFTVPDRLWRLEAPACFRTINFWDLIDEDNKKHRWDLSVRADRKLVYERLLTYGDEAHLMLYLDGALLVDLWDELRAPDPMWERWETIIEANRRTPAQPENDYYVWNDETWRSPVKVVRQADDA